MKKEQRKKMMNIIVIIVTIGMVVSVLAGITRPSSKNKSKDSGTTSNTANNASNTATVENNEAVTAEIKEAQFGSIVKISLTDKGKKQYKDATIYALFDQRGQMSKFASLGTEATVFPAMKAGDKVDIKLYTKDNKEIAFFKAKFVKGK